MNKNTLVTVLSAAMATIGLVQPHAHAMGLFDRFSYDAQSHTQRMDMSIGNNQEFKKFVATFSPPQDILYQLQRNEKNIYEGRNLPDFVVKNRDDISRIINAHRMNNYIQQKNYKHVAVAEKYIFLAGDEWKVIAQKVSQTKIKRLIDREQLKELVDVVLTLGFSDFYTDNIFVTDEGNLVFVDTEDLSFKVRGNNAWILAQLKAYFYNKLTDRAEMWLNEQLRKLDPKEAKPEIAGIYTMPELDTHGIDVDKLYQEYATIKQTSHTYFTELEKNSYLPMYMGVPGVLALGAVYFMLRVK